MIRHIPIGIFLFLHLVPAVWPSCKLWGLDFLLFEGEFGIAAFVLCSTGLLIIRWPTWEMSWWGVLLIASVAFVLFSSERHFLGDGYILLDRWDTPTFEESPRAPLSFALIRTLRWAGSHFWGTVENTFRAYSYVSGLLYVWVSLFIAGALSKTTQDRLILLAFLLTAGYMQLFFGYVEVYALYPAGLLLYLYAGLRALGGRWPIVIPALILGFLFALHQAFLVFMPSLLYVGFRLWRDKMSSLPIIVFALLCCFACSFALILICGVTPLEYVGRTGERNFLPLFGETTKDKHYNVFSITHVVDFLNQQLLVAPAAYLAVFWFRRRHFSHYPFLLIAFLFSLGSTFAANAEIGAFRDWDIFSLPSVPLLLWVALISIDA